MNFKIKAKRVSDGEMIDIISFPVSRIALAEMNRVGDEISFELSIEAVIDVRNKIDEILKGI